MANARYRRKVVKLGVGKQYVRRAVSPSEPGYVSKVREQTRAMEKAFADVIAQLEGMTPQIIMDALQPTYKLAQSYTPKDTGALLGSGYLQVTSFRGKPRVEMGFGKGGFPSYTVFVHEVPAQHAFPTSWKFLEKAVTEDMPQVIGRLQASYKGVLS